MSVVSGLLSIVRESDVERYLKSEVRRADGLCLKFVSPGVRGVPDRLVLLPGRHVMLIEVKRPGGVVKPWQHRIHVLLRRFIDVWVVDCPDDVDKLLRLYTLAGR